MATRFAYMYTTDLKNNGLAYIWYNQPAEAVERNKNFVISCLQANNADETERKLLMLVQNAGWPQAKIWEDERLLRYIRISW